MCPLHILSLTQARIYDMDNTKSTLMTMSGVGYDIAYRGKGEERVRVRERERRERGERGERVERG